MYLFSIMNLHFYTYKTYPFHRLFKIPLGTYPKGKKIDISIMALFVIIKNWINKTETDSQI